MVLCLEREKGRSYWTTSDVLEMKLHCWTVWIRVRLGHMIVSMEKMLESFVMVSLIYVMLSSVVCLCVVVCKARNSVLANTNMGLVIN